MISIAPLLLGVARPAATTTTPGASAAATARSATPFRHSAVRMQEFDPDMFAQYANPPSFDGTKLQIVEFPNPILRAANADIANFDDDFRALCKEMLSVMYGAKGVGLAAPQVGLNACLCTTLTRLRQVPSGPWANAWWPTPRSSSTANERT